MIEQQIRARGVRDEVVLAAIDAVPREIFVPESIRAEAYEDRALPIGENQTISQPFIVAYMTAQLKLTPQCKVLEIGTGSGYQTAILSHLCGEVHTMERVESLLNEALSRFTQLGLTNIYAHLGDGSVGLAEQGPFDRILVAAAAPGVPQPLADQLVDGGHLVIPTGGHREQTIVRATRRGPKIIETPLLACRFVKLLGQGGWPVEPT
jgi:protein-L-isoaspartate(D-aspartate) O-methyltransferase